MLIKEYRIPMPISVEEYRVGQLYMIAKHSHEQSEAGDGIETVHNVPHFDPLHGQGQYTEKRIHLNSKLPYWLQAITPRMFYIIEKGWNYYPYTETEYTCSFLPKFSIFIKTLYQDNSGTAENCLNLTPEELSARTLDFVDIAYDELAPKHYKEAEDPKFFKSKETNRGPLMEGWRNSHEPIMCSYKLVKVSFEVWGLQTKTEEFAHKIIREILLLGHRQAFTWIDEWYGMTVDDVREFENKMQEETNLKVLTGASDADTVQAGEGDNEDEDENAANENVSKKAQNSSIPATTTPASTPTQDESGSSAAAGATAGGLGSWFSWS